MALLILPMFEICFTTLFLSVWLREISGDLLGYDIKIL